MRISVCRCDRHLALSKGCGKRVVEQVVLVRVGWEKSSPDEESGSMGKMTKEDRHLLEIVLNSWDRNCAILLNLLRAVPSGGLEAKTTESSRSVSEMFMHMHHERMVSIAEEVPELNPRVPEQEWFFEPDANRISGLLAESGEMVREAVRQRAEAGLPFDRSYAHPIHFISFLIFHEGYHHGQIKTALKVAGRPIPDEVAGPLTWDVWRSRSDQWTR